MEFNFELFKKNLAEKLLEKKILIVAHRGTNGGNIIQNTIPAFTNALLHKADIIEVDVSKTADGVFFAFHDGQEPLVLGLKENIKTLTSAEVEERNTINSVNHKVSQKVNRLEEVLNHFKGKDCLINIDRSWFYWEEIVEYLKGFGMENQLVLKSPINEDYLNYLQKHGRNFLYMPIVNNLEELAIVEDFPNINLLAVELIFDREDNPLIADEVFERLKAKNILTWVNAITLDDRAKISACIGDNKSIIEGPEKGWGWLINKGFTIMQTDWPMLLREYVDSI